MDRRQFAIATAAFGGRLFIDPFSSFRAPAQDGDVLSPAYAESVEISGLIENGASEFEVRNDQGHQFDRRHDRTHQ
jgi:hypothetical protein